MFHYIISVRRKPNTDTSDYQGLGTPDPHPSGHSLFKLGQARHDNSLRAIEGYCGQRSTEALLARRVAGMVRGLRLPWQPPFLKGLSRPRGDSHSAISAWPPLGDSGAKIALRGLENGAVD